VQVHEPSEERAIAMLRGVASTLEQHHRVQLLDSALDAAVRLSHRYIPARQLPDKAVSLVDTACARVAVSQHATPPEVEDALRRIEMLETELRIVEREETIGEPVAERKSDVTRRLAVERERLVPLEERWKAEKALVDDILALRARLRARGAGIVGDSSTAAVEANGNAGGIDTVFTKDSFTLEASVENLTLSENSVSNTQTFDGMPAGPITNGENGSNASDTSGKLMTNTISVRHVPTARRMREIVFKILTRQIRGKRFLDLCAGCGMVGLDAVSRGAMIATFVDRSARMCDLIKKNLEFCGVREGHGEIIEAEVVPFLKKMSKRKRFWDVIYFGAPDNTDHETALEYFGRGAVIARGGLLLIEHHKELFFPEKLGILKRSRVVVVDDKAISFYERK